MDSQGSTVSVAASLCAESVAGSVAASKTAINTALNQGGPEVRQDPERSLVACLGEYRDADELPVACLARGTGRRFRSALVRRKAHRNPDKARQERAACVDAPSYTSPATATRTAAACERAACAAVQSVAF
jgi:hypothetical protein